jgi:hypothetical protein
MAPAPGTDPTRETLRQQIAEGRGFSLHRHHAEEDAAAYLGMHPVTLKKLRLAGSIGYVAKGRRASAYIGCQLADYLIDQVRPWRAIASTNSRSANDDAHSAAEVPRGTPPSTTTRPSARDVSDPQIASGTLFIRDQAKVAATIYKGYGRWSSVCSAITCWASIAAL